MGGGRSWEKVKETEKGKGKGTFTLIPLQFPRRNDTSWTSRNNGHLTFQTRHAWCDVRIASSLLPSPLFLTYLRLDSPRGSPIRYLLRKYRSRMQLFADIKLDSTHGPHGRIRRRCLEIGCFPFSYTSRKVSFCYSSLLLSWMSRKIERRYCVDLDTKWKAPTLWSEMNRATERESLWRMIRISILLTTCVAISFFFFVKMAGPLRSAIIDYCKWQRFTKSEMLNIKCECVYGCVCAGCECWWVLQCDLIRGFAYI